MIREGILLYNETIIRLEKYTDANEFERLCCDLLSRLGYRGIEPQGIGRKDGGKDALHVGDEGTTVLHFSLRKDWEKKISEDIKRTQEGSKEFKKFVFVSNQFIPPIKRDKTKEEISALGWEPAIYDQEFIRVELDNHSRDLREKYLGIPGNYSSNIEEIIEKMRDSRDEKVRGGFFSMLNGTYKRILLLAIPNEINNTRMKLFDDKMKFIADIEKLKAMLSKKLLGDNIEHRITSNSFSTYTMHLTGGGHSTFMLGSPEKHLSYSNLYNNGIIEIVFDVYFGVEEGIVLFVLYNFFDIMKMLYDGYVKNEEYITIYLCLINASRMNYKKKDGEEYSGEKYYYEDVINKKFEEIISDKFQTEFYEVTCNKLDNFFNLPSIF